MAKHFLSLSMCVRECHCNNVCIPLSNTAWGNLVWPVCLPCPFPVLVIVSYSTVLSQCCFCLLWLCYNLSSAQVFWFCFISEYLDLPLFPSGSFLAGWLIDYQRRLPLILEASPWLAFRLLDARETKKSTPWLICSLSLVTVLLFLFPMLWVSLFSSVSPGFTVGHLKPRLL